jgi:predicted phosphodiesterase
MRLAVISDIHANLPALLAVCDELKRLAPDEVIVAGDFLNRGPQPRQVVELLREKGWQLLRGNHEDYVIAQLERHHPDDVRRNPIWRPAQWTAEQIRDIEGDGSRLQSLPLSTRRANGAVLIVHGTPLKNSDGVFANTTDDELRAMLGEHPPRVLMCAHTHASLIRTVDNTLVCNVGATGLPFNGDPRAQFGLLELQNGTWHAELIRIPYDRTATYRAFKDDGFLDQGGPLARVILQEVRDARPHLGPWVRAHSAAVRDNHLTVKEATQRYFLQL